MSHESLLGAILLALYVTLQVAFGLVTASLGSGFADRLGRCRCRHAAAVR